MYMYVYMCTYIVHDCTYSAKLLRIAVYICRVESLGQRVYGAGFREPSFTWGIMWHVARRTSVAARVLSLRCGYAKTCIYTALYIHILSCTTCVSTTHTYSIRYRTSRRPYKLHLIVVGEVVNHAAQVICIALAVIRGPIQMGLDTLP